MRYKSIALLLVLVSLGLIGYWLAGEKPVQAPAATAVTSRPSSAVRLPDSSQPTSPAKLQQVRNAVEAPLPELPFKTLGEFSAALLKAFEDKSSPRQIAHLLNQSGKKLQPLDHAELLHQAFEKLASKDAKQAADVLRNLTDPSDQQLMAAGIPSLLTDKDPRAAAEFAKNLSGHDMARTANQFVSRQWAATDRESVLKWLGSTTAMADKASIAEGLAQTWAGEDMDALTKWAAGVTDPVIQSAALVKAVKVMAATDPAAAADWAAKFPDGAGKRQAIAYSATAWGTADPASAANWAQQFTDPTTRMNALSGVMRGWLNTDQPAAKAWANQLPAAERDQVLANVQSLIK